MNDGTPQHHSPLVSSDSGIPEVWAVIPAGGSGSRFSATQNKLLAELVGIPILLRTLRTLLTVPGLQGVILSASPEVQPDYHAIISATLPDASVHYAPGGRTRRESIYNGLSALPETADIVVLHDAARPLAKPALFEAVIQAVRQGSPGAIAAIPIHDTVKRAGLDGKTVADTVERDGLWRAQTPQAFDAKALLFAHGSVSADVIATDDARLMELSGLGPIALIPGDEYNLKITTAADLRLAEAFLAMEAMELDIRKASQKDTPRFYSLAHSGKW